MRFLRKMKPKRFIFVLSFVCEGAHLEAVEIPGIFVCRGRGENLPFVQ